MTLRVGRRALVSAVLLVLALALVPVAQAALTVSRAELNGTQLRVEGSGAVPNATVTIDGGAASGTADATGAFRIQKDPFSSPSCVITIANGTSTVQQTLAGCVPQAPPPPTGPSAPGPLSPANAAFVVVPFTISWSASSDPTGIVAYNWQVSASSTFSPVTKQGSTMGPTQALVSGLANGSYFWRVQAVNGAFVQGPWSQTRSATVTGVGPGEPGTPVLNPPKGGTQFHPFEAVTFTWSAVPGAASYIWEASTNPSFPATPGPGVLFINNIPTTTYTSNLFGNQEGTWFVRASAVDANGVDGVPSNSVSFTNFFNNPVSAPPTPLAPLNGVTLTLPVTLSWTDVPNPQFNGYEVQVSGSSAFSSIEQDIPLITPPNVVLGSLTAGTKFWRVRAFEGDSTPLLPAVTAWSATGSFTVSAAPAAVTSLTFTSPSPFSGDVEGGQIQLSVAAPPGGAVVSLTSSNPAAAPVPATVTVPAGSATLFAPFQFPIGQVTAPTPVTVTATLGASSTSTLITVQPPSLNNLWTTFTTTGGATVGGIVTLNGTAPPGGALVSLTSNSPAVHLPATVTVFAGNPTVSFNIPTDAVATTTTATLTATWKGAAVQSQITLTPQVAPGSITISPATTTGTNGSSGTVTLASPANGDVQIMLSSSNPAVAAVPSSVTVPQFAGGGGFLIFTSNPAVPTTVTITASGAGVSKTATLTVNPFSFSPAPLPAPTLLAPASGARFAAGQVVSFDWSDVSGAASYTIQVSSTSAFSTTAVDQVVTLSQFATSSLPIADLFWRARANDAGGKPGAWSTVLSIRVK